MSVATGASATATTGNKGEDRTANAPNRAIKMRRVIPEAKGFGAILHLFGYVGGCLLMRAGDPFGPPAWDYASAFLIIGSGCGWPSF